MYANQYIRMTDMKEIKKMNDADLKKLVEDKREEIRAFRFNAAARDVRQVRTAKREIARALTELNTRTKSEANSEVK